MSELEKFRSAKDEFFTNDPHSPLSRAQKDGFGGLEYFPENPDLRLELELQEFPDKEMIEMQTSTGDVQSHLRYGLIRFSVGSEEVQLTVYKDSHGYFLPFIDAMAGDETYGAGRYLEPQAIMGGTLLVDFNYAYNPYCAYNDMYSCPLTPFENRLPVAIKAGEKMPTGEWATSQTYRVE
jgi:uncharacterized protein (DUF1684 family)